MGFSRVFPSGRPAAPAPAAAAAAGPAGPAGPAGQKAIFNRVSEGTLDSFLVRFRGVSVLHCHGVLVWRRAVFSTGGSTTGKGWQNWQKTIFNIGTGGSTTGKGSQNWQKAIFNRISKGTLDTFLVRFHGVSVLHCHGVLVWRSIGKRLFLIGFQKGR